RRLHLKQNLRFRATSHGADATAAAGICGDWGEELTAEPAAYERHDQQGGEHVRGDVQTRLRIAQINAQDNDTGAETGEQALLDAVGRGGARQAGAEKPRDRAD